MGVGHLHDRLLTDVPGALARALDVPVERVEPHRGPPRLDLVLSADGRSFAVEFKATSSAGPVAAAATRISAAARQLGTNVVPVVVVPYMTEGGRRACREAGVSWLDLSGNAHIVAPGLRVVIEGRPDRYRRPGRPSNLFAPKSARVARWLLMHPDTAFSQQEIARSTEMTEGYVSRIVSRLESDSYVVRESNRFVRTRDPLLLMDAWRDSYRFFKHEIVRGHVAARSGDALARQLADRLASAGIDYAATGLAAAWQISHFAGFRLATFYVRQAPTDELQRLLGFREESRGANVWLVVPNDEGVFQGASDRDNIRCVHPVQVYLDLKEHPERASEAADRLREELFPARDKR